jgi:hypothetical protein
MGRLIKNHWARLVIIIAAAVQVGGSIQAFFWPKVTWDFFTSAINMLVKPYPILQISNLGLGVIVLAWEWPLSILAGSMLHRSIPVRLVVYAISALFSLCLYESHNAFVYYMLGIYGYALALIEHEVTT